jgi:hypothetical protein
MLLGLLVCAGPSRGSRSKRARFARMGRLDYHVRKVAAVVGLRWLSVLHDRFRRSQPSCTREPSVPTESRCRCIRSAALYRRVTNCRSWLETDRPSRRNLSMVDTVFFFSCVWRCLSGTSCEARYSLRVVSEVACCSCSANKGCRPVVRRRGRSRSEVLPVNRAFGRGRSCPSSSAASLAVLLDSANVGIGVRVSN